MIPDKNTIAILDFGGQYAHLITNRIRRLGVHAVIRDHDTPAAELKDFAGLILSGGPQSVNAEQALLADPDIFELGIPTLGICYGHQVTTHVLGGKVEPGETKEYSKTKLHIDHQEGIFTGLNTDALNVWMSHWDEVTDIPTEFEVLAHTDINDFAAVGNLEKNIFGIQFHPEVTHTEQGMTILENFVNLTDAEKTWNTANYLETITDEVTAAVEKAGRKVFMLVSGGVDSVVGFTLLNKVLGSENVTGMLVDTGFMRKEEIEEVQAALYELGIDNLHVNDAKEQFYSALKGVHEPEEKRQIIGKLFIDIQAQAVKDMGLDPEHWMLGQGTIYPDTIESGATKNADKIKTHHNRVPEIQEMIDQGLVIEPLADLYKDEVRQLGEQLGLPHHLVWRHPFPGPGLAIRMLCTGSGQAELDLEEEQSINDYLAAHGLTGKILPVQSVGVQGDARTYRHPLALFPAEGKSWQNFWDHDEMQALSTELTNRFESINRVILCLQSDSHSFTLLENKDANPNRVSFLQDADKIVMDEISSYDLEEKSIWQCPTVLLPLSAEGNENEALLVRPINSIDAMTASFVFMPPKNLNNILDQLADLKASAVFYDLTNKPPGTIEWE